MEWLWLIVILIVAAIGLFAAIRYIKSNNNKENDTVPTDYVNKQDVLDVMQLLECLDEVYKME